MKHQLALLGVIALLATVPAAQADPVTVTFTGPGGYGLDPNDAAASGVPILTLSDHGSALGILEVVDQHLFLDTVRPFPATGPGPHTATSDWQVANVSDQDLPETFLLFLSSSDFVADGVMVSYADPSVGLVIDPDDGWRIVNAGGRLYPALNLGVLESGMITAPFAVNYFKDGPLTLVGTEFQLPRYDLAMAQIPEPGTFTLVGLGLAVLAATRRRRP